VALRVDKRDRAAALSLIVIVVALAAGFLYWRDVERQKQHDLTERQSQQLLDDLLDEGVDPVPFVPSPAGGLGGYENPAPGNDGSYDCPPGGEPVYVGSNDPAGLDADSDGWGCE
jgi:hypothetical protein